MLMKSAAFSLWHDFGRNAPTELASLVKTISMLDSRRALLQGVYA